jgi:hypothetical protein
VKASHVSHLAQEEEDTEDDEEYDGQRPAMCLTWRRKRKTQKMMKNMMARMMVKASHVSRSFRTSSR